MTKLIEKALEKIKAEKILPKPRWEFSAGNIARWILWVGALALGAVLILVLANEYLGIEWDSRRHLRWGFFRFLFFFLPPLWILITAAALVLAYFGFRSTKYGYRYSVGRIIAVCLATLAGIIILSFLLRIDDPAYRMMKKGLPFAEGGLGAKENVWSRPEEGLLSGTVRAYDSQSRIFILIDFSGKEWEITLEEGAFIPPRLGSLPDGTQVKLLGEKSGENRFQAEELRPWMRPGERMHDRGKMRGRMRGGMMRGGFPDSLEN